MMISFSLSHARPNLTSSEVIIKVHIRALGHLVDQTHLEQLVDHLEHEVFGVEVLESRAHPLVDVVE